MAIPYLDVKEGETLSEFYMRMERVMGRVSTAPETKAIAEMYYMQENIIKSRKKYSGIIGRFTVTSPSFGGGIQTQSVRDLTRNQFESLVARGYKVEATPPNTRLRPSANIVTRKYGIVMHQKRKWAGIPRTWTQTMQTGHTIVKRSAVKVRQQKRLVQEPSTRYHQINNLFSMPMFSEPLVEYWDERKKRVIRVKESTAQALIRRGWKLTRYYGTRSPSGSQAAIARGSRGRVISPTPGQIQYSSDLSTKIQQLTQELQNQKNWIEEMNRRLSQQMVDMGEAATGLGQATTQRSQEIGALDEWTQQQIKRIDETLINLGNATTDASKAASAAKAENTVKQVGNQIQQKTGSITEGITGFFTQPSNIILIVIVVMMLVMMRK